MHRAGIVRSFTRVAATVTLLAACSSSSSPPAPPAQRGEERTPSGRGLDPTAVRTSAHPSLLDTLDDIDETPEPSVRTPGETVGVVASPATLDLAAPPHGCVAITRAPTRVIAAGGPASITATVGGFVVAGYMPGASSGSPGASSEEVVAVRLSPSSPTSPLATLMLGPGTTTPRVAPPMVSALDNGRVLVAATDARGAVRVVILGVSSPTMRPELRTIGRGADLRFAPAIAPLRGGAAAIAYTDGSGMPMRVRLAVVRPDLSTASTHDLTPQSLGASAPVADTLAEVPEIVFLDARGGLSPVVRVALGEDGAPRPAQIDRPLSTVSEPAHIATAHVGPRRFVAYTAIGRAATSAIGIVELGGTLPAEPLVPGVGYGVLQLGAVSAPAAAIFAVTRPLPGAAAADRFNAQVLARVVDAAGIGPELAVTGAEERVSHAAIARAADGTVGVAYTTSAGVSVAWLRCADH